MKFILLSLFFVNSVKFVKDSQNIYVNSRDLTIRSATLASKSSGLKNDAVKIDTNTKTEQVCFDFGNLFKRETEAVLTIEFSGKLTDDLCGFYRSGYNDKDGNKRYI